MNVGVLALQGSSEPHLAHLRRLGNQPTPVRRVDELEGLSHLVIPGGESTTLHHLMQLFGLWDPVRRAITDGRLAAFGTCAGAILLGRPDSERPPRMDVLDAEVNRNSYGRQIDSFSQSLELDLPGGPNSARGVFIRAPRFGALGPDIQVRARCGGEPVMIEGRGVLAAAFHPELTEELCVHRYFLDHCQPASAGHPQRKARGLTSSAS